MRAITFIQFFPYVYISQSIELLPLQSNSQVSSQVKKKLNLAFHNTIHHHCDCWFVFCPGDDNVDYCWWLGCINLLWPWLETCAFCTSLHQERLWSAFPPLFYWVSYSILEKIMILLCNYSYFRIKHKIIILRTILWHSSTLSFFQNRLRRIRWWHITQWEVNPWLNSGFQHILVTTTLHDSRAYETKAWYNNKTNIDLHLLKDWEWFQLNSCGKIGYIAL